MTTTPLISTSIGRPAPISRAKSGEPPIEGLPHPTTFADRLTAARDILTHAGDLGDVDLNETLAETVFGDIDHLLEFLHRRWITLFGVALDDELESTTDDVATCVERAWRNLAVREQQLYLFLTRHASHPVVRLGTQRHQQLLEETGAKLPAFA